MSARTPANSLPSESVISLDNVRFAYPGDASEALRGITLSVRSGEHVCVLGGNGSGKSTLARLVNALLLPSDGRIRVFGLDSREPDAALAIRRRAAMVFQHPEDQMVTSIVADDVAFGPENLGVPQPEISRRVDEALAAVGMTDRAQADPADLSGGQKQRVAIAGALAMEPQVLLLDEPSAMLDTEGRRAIQDIVTRLHKRGVTIIHITHFMDDALLADRVVVMERGRVALEGTPDEVFAQTRRIRELGLEMPFALRLSERLSERGFALPMTADADELADALAPQIAMADASCNVKAAKRERSAAAGADKTNGTAPTNAVPAIAFEHVSFSYAHATSARKRQRHHLFARSAKPARTEDLAVRSLSFAVAEGSLTALVGHTGSGKSTTVELTCALKIPCAGTVRVTGIDTADLARRRELRHLIGYVSQLPERQLFAETVREDIAFGPRNLGLSDNEIAERTREALAAVGLPADDALLNRSPFALSGGQQRGVALAGILAMRPRILVLDEPMAGLDPAGRVQMRTLLARLKHDGTTMLLVTHNMDDVAELADHVIVLNNGQVTADGTPADVFAGATNAAAKQNVIGLPPALAFARALEMRGISDLGNPLTLDDLVQEVSAHGTAR